MDKNNLTNSQILKVAIIKYIELQQEYIDQVESIKDEWVNFSFDLKVSNNSSCLIDNPKLTFNDRRPTKE